MDLPTTEMALQFVLSNPNVSTACSGMNRMEQLEQNSTTARTFDPDRGNFEAMCEGLDRLRAALGERFCTMCRYCTPCPSGVDIPRHMEIHRQTKCFGLANWAPAALKSIPETQRAAKCNECGLCETKCPNTLPIRATLKELRVVAGDQ
jgi:predicted aldo/keto reductase-like oxidoreductase